MRFFNEARAVNRIDHTGIVQCYDCAQLADGTPFIVMEYLKGETLATRARRERRKLPAAQVLRWARQIAAALTAAHEKDIVHRDLKPDNVMLVPDLDLPGGERVKLLDFGIAKLRGPARGMASTRKSVVMGTPAYMSPEQCRGVANVDEKSDVYSLGVPAVSLPSGQSPTANPRLRASV